MKRKLSIVTLAMILLIGFTSCKKDETPSSKFDGTWAIAEMSDASLSEMSGVNIVFSDGSKFSVTMGGKELGIKGKYEYDSTTITVTLDTTEGLSAGMKDAGMGLINGKYKYKFTNNDNTLELTDVDGGGSVVLNRK